MLTVSTELQPILNGIVQFISYMVLAVFAENVVLARALGVTRLMKLVPDHRAQVWDFCLPLLLVITLSAPAGWAAHDLFFPWLRDYLPAGPRWAATQADADAATGRAGYGQPNPAGRTAS